MIRFEVVVVKGGRLVAGDCGTEQTARAWAKAYQAGGWSVRVWMWRGR